MPYTPGSNEMWAWSIIDGQAESRDEDCAMEIAVLIGMAN